MNPLEYLNANPALMSIIAFPVGLILLLGVLKLFGLDPKEFLKALKDHTSAELKIEERIQDFVNEIKNLIQAQVTSRQYVESRMAVYDEKLSDIQHDLTVLLSIAKKRKSDWLGEPNTEAFKQPRTS